MNCKRQFEMNRLSGGSMQRSRYALLTMIVLLAVCSYATVGANPSITIGGSEQSSGGVWDHGTITVIVNGSQETVQYGQFSTPFSIASAIAAAFTKDCSST